MLDLGDLALADLAQAVFDRAHPGMAVVDLVLAVIDQNLIWVYVKSFQLLLHPLQNCQL